MKHNPRKVWPRLICAALLAAALVALLRVRGRQIRQEHARPFGRLTAQQVLSTSEPICRAVAARPDPFILTAEALPGPDSFWTVICADPTGHDLLDLTWDADTGELSNVGVWMWQSRNPGGPVMNLAKAIASSRYWLRALRSSPAPDKWRLLHCPACLSNDVWILAYTAEGYHAIIEVEAHQGGLTYAQFLREDRKSASVTPLRSPRSGPTPAAP